MRQPPRHHLFFEMWHTILNAMRTLSLSILCLGAFCFLFAEASVECPGALLRFYPGKEGKTFVVVTQEATQQSVRHFSSDLKPLGHWSLPLNTEWLPNHGFEHALVFMEPRKEVDTVTLVRGALRWMALPTGAIYDMKVPVRSEKSGAWVTGKAAYLWGGRLFTFGERGVASERVSGAPYAILSPSLSVCAQFLFKRGDEGLEGTVTVENLKNQEMVNVESFRLSDSAGPLLKFSEDSRYLFYRAGETPALYDFKELRGLGIPDVHYKFPRFTDVFLDGNKFFVFHDYRGIVLVGRKSFEVEDVLPNPFGAVGMRIEQADNRTLTGLLYEERKELTLYTHAFKVILEGMEPEAKRWEFPVNTLLVESRGKKALVVYFEDGRFKQTEVPLK